MTDLSERIICHYERHALAGCRSSQRGVERQTVARPIRRGSAARRGNTRSRLRRGRTDRAPSRRGWVPRDRGRCFADVYLTLSKPHARSGMDGRRHAIHLARQTLQRRPCLGQLLSSQPRRSTQDVPAVRGACVRVGAADVQYGGKHGEAIGSYRGDPLYHASLDAAEYRALLAASGFDVIAHTVEDPLVSGRTAWLARSSVT